MRIQGEGEPEVCFAGTDPIISRLQVARPDQQRLEQSTSLRPRRTLLARRLMAHGRSEVEKGHALAGDGSWAGHQTGQPMCVPSRDEVGVCPRQRVERAEEGHG